MKIKVLFISIAPPENHCGVRVVMYRHLVERNPFELLVATSAEYSLEPQPHLYLRIPYLLYRLQKSRFGPYFRSLLLDFENLIWFLLPNRTLDEAINSFQPDVLLVLADNSLAEMAIRAAKKYKLPLVGLFLDWFPIMDGYYGHSWSCELLSRRFRKLYKTCDLALCTSNGMKEVLGNHPNNHVIYPMPGQHKIPNRVFPPSTGRFRLVYVGSVQNFYGRMMCDLIQKFESTSDLEFIVVGPNADWPKPILETAKLQGIYLGFKPPEESGEILAGADALLVVMSFDEKYELFMKTSFTTKFLDYVAFSKPIILWGPEYCTPVQVVRQYGGAIVVNRPDASEVIDVCKNLATDSKLKTQLIEEAQYLHQSLFNPDRLQNIFVSEIEKLVSIHSLKK
ncbi:hypothetical protein VB711_23540 [Cronbergia sp. UHCC 0137]|uniref:hypothetical protein n=1 Tax=Cronbergia sp. UHCC 0137 TaxID=3110239 RepID=UPI002B214CCF|nr:hypothetical protein [Cronbergia sp. UHCC 0137]MEA5620788.1 hypothetical protein [Cronbergia sp. UHCC 0137]